MTTLTAARHTVSGCGSDSNLGDHIGRTTWFDSDVLSAAESEVVAYRNECQLRQPRPVAARACRSWTLWLAAAWGWHHVPSLFSAVGSIMAVIFDTSTVRPEDRADRLRVAMAEASASSVALLGDGVPVRARLDVWQLGESYLFRAESSPVRMSRTDQQARRDPVPLLALAVQERGLGLHRQFDPLSGVRPGALMGMDMTEAFEFSWLGEGASRALMMPLEQLDLPRGLLRDALPRLARSPLHGLVTAHVVELFNAADALSAHPSAREVASSSIELARALVASLSPQDAVRSEVAAQTLWTRIREYVRQNLRDPGLNAASIAAAHNISVRKLYSVCAEAGVSLEQLIIRRRLRGVRDELAWPAARLRSIESVARGWGFRNVSHFTRRFGQEFGISPREWRGMASGLLETTSELKLRALTGADKVVGAGRDGAGRSAVS